MRLSSAIGCGLVLIFVSEAVAADKETRTYRATPFKIESTDDLPSDLKFKHRSFRTETTIHYLVEGEGFARFESLAIKSIKTPDGREISDDAEGHRMYEPWNRGDVSIDGKYCVFSITLPKSHFGHAEKLDIQGYATILIGSNPREEKVELNEGDIKGKKHGPLTVLMKANPQFGVVLDDVPRSLPTTDAAGAAPASTLKKSEVQRKLEELYNSADASPILDSTPQAIPATAPVGTSTATPPVIGDRRGGGKSAAAAYPERRSSVSETPVTAPSLESKSVPHGGSGISFLGASDYPIAVEISGPRGIYIDSKLYDGNEEVSGAFSASEDFMAHYIPKPKSGKLTVVIRHWDSVKAVRAPLEALKVTNDTAAADEASSVKGSMTIKRKKYDLTNVKAYRIRSDGRDSVAVIVSEKRFIMAEPELFPVGKFGKPRWISLTSISVPTDFAAIRHVVPHLQAVFEEKTGKVTSYQGWADGTTFMSIAGHIKVTFRQGDVEKGTSVNEVNGEWTAKIAGNRISGTGTSKSDLPDGESFDFEFESPIEKLSISVPD